MGGSHGRHKHKKEYNISDIYTPENGNFNENISEPELSDDEVTMLREMWTIVNKHVAKVGTVLFVDLFETHPEVEDVFMSFRNNSSSEQEYQHIIRAHALRVMGTVDKCIYRLNNRDKLRELMFGLGKRHKNYNMKTDQIELMGPQFITSIKPHLENMWTKEHEHAWENLFLLMCYHMKKGMRSISYE